jgi:hypothetical protein
VNKLLSKDVSNTIRHVIMLVYDKFAYDLLTLTTIRCMEKTFDFEIRKRIDFNSLGIDLRVEIEAVSGRATITMRDGNNTLVLWPEDEKELE